VIWWRAAGPVQPAGCGATTRRWLWFAAIAWAAALELALACRYRMAVDEPGTKLGLPEVMLGIFPGWGGMLRLPQRVGPAAALDMMLTGKTLDAKRAKKMGLADLCVPPRVMENAARMRVVLSGKRAARPFCRS
jgi:3-hydroxyacyl-CoA dehydrogenase/enoyl-CoA hydratase/3-hydroxybutyryl-CoA epimerase